MPNERASMSKLKQLIALRASNVSVRALARAPGLSFGWAARAAVISPASPCSQEMTARKSPAIISQSLRIEIIEERFVVTW